MQYKLAEKVSVAGKRDCACSTNWQYKLAEKLPSMLSMLTGRRDVKKRHSFRKKRLLASLLLMW